VPCWRPTPGPTAASVLAVVSPGEPPQEVLNRPPVVGHRPPSLRSSRRGEPSLLATSWSSPRLGVASPTVQGSVFTQPLRRGDISSAGVARARSGARPRSAASRFNVPPGLGIASGRMMLQ
jgi:hypothetical protein